MAEPSLSELYSYTPRPELATGERDVVPDNRAAIQDAIGLAKDYNEGIAQRYALYQKALADKFKAGDVDYAGVNPNHLPELKQKAANYFSILYKNPAALGGINKDPQVEADLAAAKDDLERSIAASKQQYTYASSQDAFMNRTPELITDDNKNIIKGLYTAPLGQFQPQTLQLPAVIDIPTLSKTALEQSKKERSIFEQEFLPKRTATGALVPRVAGGKVELDAQGQPVFEQEYTGRYKSGIVKEADYDSYMKLGESLFDSNQPVGKYNQPIQQSLKSIYDRLPENQKIQIENAANKNNVDPLKYFFEKTWSSRFDKMTDLSGVKEIEDVIYKQKADLRNDLEKMKVRFGYDVYLKKLEGETQKDLELWRDKQGLRDVDKGGEALNDMVAGTLSNALSAGAANYREIRKRDGTIDAGWRKVSLPPQVLEFMKAEMPVMDGKKQKIVNGKPVLATQKPVEVWVNEAGTEVRPIFASEEMPGGKRGITNPDLSQPMTVDQYKQVIAQGLGLEKSLDASTRMLQRMEGFNFPTLNGNVELYIKNRASGNYNPDKGGGGTVSVNKTATTSGATPRQSVDVFTRKELLDNGWKPAQIDEAVKSGKIKLQ